MPAGELRTRRWNDPARPDDGLRLLVTRYRPRGVARADETWDEWWLALAPSPALHAAAWGKHGPALATADYRRRYVDELSYDPGRFHLRALVDKVAGGQTVTLLCSSACVDEARCHRTVLRELVERALGR